jgi:hypothetical protein
MGYKVNIKTKAFNKPGISPTTKNGTDLGWVEAGFMVPDEARLINGWFEIMHGGRLKWIKKLDCIEADDEPTPEPNVKLLQIRRGERVNGVDMFEDWEQYEREI